MTTKLGISDCFDILSAAVHAQDSLVYGHNFMQQN